MNTKVTPLPAIGEAFAGGFYAGKIQVGGLIYALIVSPAAGDFAGTWGEYGTDLSGAVSCFDGYANTVALAAARSDIAIQVQALAIDGHTDWYIPSRDELEILYRAFKPTENENECSFRDGDNASSIPGNYPYTANNPSQTAIDAFCDDGTHALRPAYYWSSTQYSPSYAFVQGFENGDQCGSGKDNEHRVRAVRRASAI